MKRKYFILIFLFIVLCGAGVGFYLFNKPSPHASSKKPDYTLSTAELAKAFETNETQANKTYSGKVIQVSGKVTDLITDKQGLVTIQIEGTPGSSVSCIFEKDPGQLISKGDSITLKGFCAGFDDLFGEVKMHSCGLIK